MPSSTPAKRNTLRKVAVALLWLALWAGAAALVGRDLLLPGPVTTAKTLVRLMGDAAFWRGCAATLLRIVTGFLLGLLCGGLLGALCWRFSFCNAFFSPFLSIVKATPVASFILLAFVWIRVNHVPALIASIIVVPIAFTNISGGLAAMDDKLREMAYAFGMRPVAQLRYLYFPSLRPYLRAAVAAGMGMAWKSGVAAEVLCTPKYALGSTMYRAKIYLETPELLAATAVVVVLSFLLEKAALRLMGAKGGEKDDA